jgi:hypothetical protein
MGLMSKVALTCFLDKPPAANPHLFTGAVSIYNGTVYIHSDTAWVWLMPKFSEHPNCQPELSAVLHERLERGIPITDIVVEFEHEAYAGALRRICSWHIVNPLQGEEEVAKLDTTAYKHLENFGIF